MQHSSYLLYLLLGALHLSGCATSGLLQKGDYLLTEQRIEGTQKISKERLERCQRQRPNETWLGMPWGRWMYYLGWCWFDKEALKRRLARLERELKEAQRLPQRNKKAWRKWEQRRIRTIDHLRDRIEEGNMLMRWGEAPVVYDPLQQNLTEVLLARLLRKKGFFDATVDSSVELARGQAAVTYHLHPQDPYLLKQLSVQAADPLMTALLAQHKDQSWLRQGDRYDEELLEQERDRIYTLLINNGYYRFDQERIYFNVIQRRIDHTVAIETKIRAGAKEEHPGQHTIRRIVWTIKGGMDTSPNRTLWHKGVMFSGIPDYISAPLLVERLSLTPPVQYSDRQVGEIRGRLSNLNIFKQIRVECIPEGPDGLAVYIHTTLPKRHQVLNEVGVMEHGGIPRRPFGSVSIMKQHLLGQLDTTIAELYQRSELLSFSANGGLSVPSWQRGMDVSIAWPQFLFPFLHSAWRQSWQAASAQTTLSAGGSIAHSLSASQQAAQGTLDYTWRSSDQHTYTWRPIQLNLVRNTEKKRVHTYLLSVASLQRLWQTPTLLTEDYYPFEALAISLDSAGLLQRLIRFDQWAPWLDYYQYCKLDVAYRQHVPIYRKSALAYCVHIGAAYPYGKNGKLPASEYYSVGGGDNMRGWHPCQLGPGCYANQSGKKQAGEILLRSSVEWRQLLASGLEGAIFVDAGNVWSWREKNRPGSALDPSSLLTTIAWNTGVGTRLNLSWAIVRLDMGVKLYDPSRAVAERLVGRSLWEGSRSLWQETVWHLTIGYPF